MEAVSLKSDEEYEKVIAERIKKRCRLTGEFTLRSGQKSEVYFDKYRFESDPALLFHVSICLFSALSSVAPNLRSDDLCLAGLELGGIPLVTIMSLQANCTAVFVRKTRKEYGTCNIVEGADVRGRDVVVVEDVITTGGAVFDAIDNLRKEGAGVAYVVCAIFRGDDEVRKRFEAAGVTLVTAFTSDDLK